MPNRIYADLNGSPI